MTPEQKIIKHIKTTGLKLTYIADKTGIGYQHLRYALNESELTASEFLKITQCLNLNIEEFVE